MNEPADPLWDSALEMIKELEKVFTVHSHQFNAIYEDAKSTLNDEVGVICICTLLSYCYITVQVYEYMTLFLIECTAILARIF